MCGGRALTLELSQLRDRTVPKLSRGLTSHITPVLRIFLLLRVSSGCHPRAVLWPVSNKRIFFVYFQTLLSVHCLANDVHRLANVHCLANVHAIVSPMTSNRTLSIPPFSPGQRPRARTQCPSRKNYPEV